MLRGRLKLAGIQIVIEGSDGVGKSSLVESIKEYLINGYDMSPENIITCAHPGATPLGQELRQLIKHREDIEIDPMTERMLFACDNNAYVETVLKPALYEGKIVISDRSNFISDYAYGIPYGVPETRIKQLHDLINAPKIDMMILLQCPWNIAKTRIFGDIYDGEQKACKIESRGDEYFEKVSEFYNNMTISKYSGFYVGNYVQNMTKIDASTDRVLVNQQVYKVIDGLMS